VVGAAIALAVIITVTTLVAGGSSSPSGCSRGGTVAPCTGAGLSGAGGWNAPVLDQEFDGTSLNKRIWSPLWFSSGATPNGVPMLPSNVAVAKGDLDLTLTGRSGGIVSTNPADQQPDHVGFQFTYGFVEARIYLPETAGRIANWPAWWTDSQHWPISGEMDVVEGLGGQACWHFHYGTSVADEHGPGGCSNRGYAGWHIYGAKWQKGEVTYYYDGVVAGRVTTGVTGSPMYLILESSAGAESGPSVRPATMRVDYVRIWQ
jgi:beta-glucanase (GH16 family)